MVRAIAVVWYYTMNHIGISTTRFFVSTTRRLRYVYGIRTSSISQTIYESVRFRSICLKAYASRLKRLVYQLSVDLCNHFCINIT